MIALLLHHGLPVLAGAGVANALYHPKPKGSALSAHPDAELIAAATELHAIGADYVDRLRPIIKGDDEAASKEAWDYCDTTLWPREYEIIQAVINTTARTPEGMRAKAAVLELWLNREVPTFITDSFEDCAENHERLAMSLCRDLLGRDAA